MSGYNNSYNMLGRKPVKITHRGQHKHTKKPCVKSNTILCRNNIL